MEEILELSDREFKTMINMCNILMEKVNDMQEQMAMKVEREKW